MKLRCTSSPVNTIPLPVSFFAVLCVTIALLIFFGAWAVSSDVEDRNRVLAFAVPGGASLNAEISSETGQSLSLIDSLSDEDVQNPADTWWGSALLTACPLH